MAQYRWQVSLISLDDLLLFRPSFRSRGGGGGGGQNNKVEILWRKTHYT